MKGYYTRNMYPTWCGHIMPNYIPIWNNKSKHKINEIKQVVSKTISNSAPSWDRRTSENVKIKSVVFRALWEEQYSPLYTVLTVGCYVYKKKEKTFYNLCRRLPGQGTEKYRLHFIRRSYKTVDQQKNKNIRLVTLITIVHENYLRFYRR